MDKVYVVIGEGASPAFPDGIYVKGAFRTREGAEEYIRGRGGELTFQRGSVNMWSGDDYFKNFGILEEAVRD